MLFLGHKHSRQASCPNFVVAIIARPLVNTPVSGIDIAGPRPVQARGDKSAVPRGPPKTPARITPLLWDVSQVYIRRDRG